MFSSKFNGLSVEREQVFSSDKELLAFAEKLSKKSGAIEDKILHWEFGPVMNMKFDPEAPNYLFSAEAVPLHWDGAFYREPSNLLFYCVETNGEGGETVFLNTELLWNSLSDEEKDECHRITLRYTTEKKAHYGGEIVVSLVQKHPETGAIILRMAEEVETKLNPVTLEILGSGDSVSFYQRMKKKLYDPKFQYVHKWQRGDLVVCDNFTYLHGRRALENNLSRSFKRIQIL